jgi:hypothetical protein
MVVFIPSSRRGGKAPSPLPSLVRSAGVSERAFHEPFDDFADIDIADTRADGFGFYIYPPYSNDGQIRTNDPAKYQLLSDNTGSFLRIGPPNNLANQGDLWGFHQPVWNDPTQNRYSFAHRLSLHGPIYWQAWMRWGPTPPPNNGFPAFWAMPMQAWAGSPNEGPVQRYTELDFIEHNPAWWGGDPADVLFGVPSFYWDGASWVKYAEPGTHESNYLRDLVDPFTGAKATMDFWTRWHEVGCLVTPGTGPGDPTTVRNFLDGELVKTRIDSSDDAGGTGSWVAQNAAPTGPADPAEWPLPGLLDHDYVMVLGSGEYVSEWREVAAWTQAGAHG